MNVVPSFGFLAFAALVAVAINLSQAVGWRRGVLLVANLAFFLSFARNPVDLVPFAGLLAMGYLFVRVARWNKGKLLTTLAIATVLIAFCWLKRYVFVPHAAFLPFAYLTLGMSYVFFRIMSLVIDAFQDTLPSSVSLLSYVNYTLNFTAFVAGPIQFYKDYLRTESERPASLDRQAVGRALERIVVGFFKVTVLSPLFFALQTFCVAGVAPGEPFWQQIGLAGGTLAVFPVYLYLNFSGYTDFVIGVARFLRLELPENFNNPFISEGYLEYWSRWHMTLSNWLKTYVYSPLVMTLMRRYPSVRIEPLLGVFAFFVTFFLIGLWHGQTSMFLCLGLLMGLGASVNKLYQIGAIARMGRAPYRALCARPLYSAVSRGLTFTWVAFTLLWFWSSWSQLSGFVRVLNPIGVAAALAAVLIGSTAVLWGLKVWQDRAGASRLAGAWAGGGHYARVAFVTVLAVATISVAVVLNAPAPHIVYKAF